MTPADYCARHDPDFVDAVLTDLLAHFGELRHLEPLFRCDAWEARDAIVIGRRVGLVIVAEQGRPGYRCIGFARPTNRRGVAR